MRYVLFFFFLWNGYSLAQNKMQLTGSAATGLNSILGGYSTGVYSNTVYYAATLGIRMNNTERFSFSGFEAGFSKRGIRVNRYFGSPFLPEKNNSYTNRYASLRYFYGKYYNSKGFIKGVGSLEYLFYSNQYDFKNITYYRSVNRFSPGLELAWGSDLNISSGMKGFIELTTGLLILRPNFFHFGLRFGFYFKEAESDTRTY